MTLMMLLAWLGLSEPTLPAAKAVELPTYVCTPPPGKVCGGPTWRNPPPRDRDQR